MGQAEATEPSRRTLCRAGTCRVPFRRAPLRQAPASGDGGGLPSLTQLAQPNGLIHGVNRAAVLLGVVAFGIAATQIASEYSLGTLRQLLVRQPRRPILLAGKFLAVLTFMLGAVVFSSVVATVASVVMAHARHVPTARLDLERRDQRLDPGSGGPPLGDSGIHDPRSGGRPAVPIFGHRHHRGLCLPDPGRSSGDRIAPHTATWLPGQLLQAVAAGGLAPDGFAHSLILSTVYLVIAWVVATVVFVRKDVTA